MRHQDKVAVLLATYNGERFLAEQLDSVLNQSHENIIVLARDDGSADGTRDILARYAREHGPKVRILEDGLGNLGVTKNFSILMQNCDTRYFMCCDQDDVWLPDKITRLLTRMKQLEGEHDATTPILIHSDLVVVDRHLVTISPSYWAAKRIHIPSRKRFSRLLIENIVTGCASMGNAALLRLSAPIPAGAVIHDWWLALVAHGHGILDTVPAATVLYRQHGGNVIGLDRTMTFWQGRHMLQQPRLLLTRMQRVSGAYAAQARALRDVAPDRLPDSRKNDIESLVQLSEILRGNIARWKNSLSPVSVFRLLRSCAPLFKLTY